MKTETKVITELDYHEFDDLCNQHVPLKVVNEKGEVIEWSWECVADEEWHNDTEHVYNFEEIDLNDSDTVALLDGLWTDDAHYSLPSYMVGTLIQVLQSKGVLPKNTIIIKVSW